MWVVNYAAPGVAIAGLGVTYYALMKKGLNLERQNEEYTAYVMSMLSKSKGTDEAVNVNLHPTPSRSWEGLTHREVETRINMRRKNALRSRSLGVRKTALTEIPISFSTPKCCPNENVTCKGRKKSTVSNSPLSASSYTYLKTKFKSIGPTNGSSEGLNSAIVSSEEVTIDNETEGRLNCSPVGLVRSKSNASSASKSSSSDFTPIRTRASLGNMRTNPPTPIPPRRFNKANVTADPKNSVTSAAESASETPPPFPPPKLSLRTQSQTPPIPPRRRPDQIRKTAANSIQDQATDVRDSVMANGNPGDPINGNIQIKVGEVQVDEAGHGNVDISAAKDGPESSVQFQQNGPFRDVDVSDVQDDSGVSESESGSIITVVQSKSATPCRSTGVSVVTEEERSVSSLSCLDDDEVCESVSKIQVADSETTVRTSPLPISCSDAMKETERINCWLVDVPSILQEPSKRVTKDDPHNDSAQFLLHPSSSESLTSTEDSAVAVVETSPSEPDDFTNNLQHRRRPRSRSCDFIRIHELAVEDILRQVESSGDFIPLKRAQSLPHILQLDIQYGQVPSWDIKGGGDADKGSLSLLIPIELFNRKFSVNLTVDVVLTIAFLVSICIITFQIWPAPGQQNQWHW